MKSALAPRRLTIRAYGVGFGDCFLLTFEYRDRGAARHVLIDFGSTQKPPHGDGRLLNAIADDIAEVTGGHLDVLVATHRHSDHINGFATRTQGRGPGNRIASLQPSLVANRLKTNGRQNRCLFATHLLRTPRNIR